jgi:hypothetical protein
MLSDGGRQAMANLAGSFAEDDLRSRAYSLYERFRPQIPAGRAGWGAKGQLDLELIPKLAGE